MLLCRRYTYHGWTPGVRLVNIYVSVQLADEVDAAVRTVRLKGAVEDESFIRLTRVIESAVRHYARGVVIDRDQLGTRAA